MSHYGCWRLKTVSQAVLASETHWHQITFMQVRQVYSSLLSFFDHVFLYKIISRQTNKAHFCNKPMRLQLRCAVISFSFSAKELGASECMNPNDYDKPIQQVCSNNNNNNDNNNLYNRCSFVARKFNNKPNIKVLYSAIDISSSCTHNYRVQLG